MKVLRKNLKYIFPVIVIVMIAGLILSRVHRPDQRPPEPEVQINASEASDYIGTAAEVCGEVVATSYLPQIGGKPTFLNFGRPDPNQLFTVVIWGENRNKWEQPPEQIYLNRNICSSGVIEEHKGIPQIIVEQPGQIELQE